MLTAIIATHESERTLVPTLAALVPGATAGLLTEVVVADAGSKDATAEVADFAGCRFLTPSGALGARLKAAVQTARTPWLLFLRPGTVPEPGWVTAVVQFIAAGADEDRERAAVFRSTSAADPMRPALSDFFALLRAAIAGAARPEQGLLIARRLYDSAGGHPEHETAEAALLTRLGRRRLATLPVSARPPR
jgi:glycosyltransferase involved in cell wall biosynthesis